MSLADVSGGPRALSEPQERILAVAGEIFRREGFAGATVDSVAAIARVSKESIYDAFPTKAALFEAAVRASIDMNSGRPLDYGQATSVDAFFERMGASMFERFVEPINFGLFRNNIEAANHFPDLASALHEHRRQASRASATCLQPLIDRGDLRMTSAMDIVIRFSSMCIGGTRYFLGAPFPTKAARARLVDRAVALFLDGYGAVTSGKADLAAPSFVRAQVAQAGVRMSPARIAEMLGAIGDEFLAHGYRSASIERAVSVVKVGKTTVYRQFGNKEGVFRHIVANAIDAEAAFEYDVAGTAATLPQALASLARQAMDHHCQDRSIRLHRLLIQEAEAFPELARAFYDARIHAIGKALCTVTESFGAPLPDRAATEDFYNLATSALRYLTLKDLPGADERARDAAEISRLFVEGARRPA